jgi:predicted dehydrogenase
MEVRTGDIYVPKVEPIEPLRKQCIAFIDSLKNGKHPIANAEMGIKTVRILEAGQKSLINGGAYVQVNQ